MNNNTVASSGRSDFNNKIHVKIAREILKQSFWSILNYLTISIVSFITKYLLIDSCYDFFFLQCYRIGMIILNRV